MRVQTGLVLLLCLLACAGCSKQKSTDELIADLKSGKEIEGVIAARTLPRGKGDAAKVVPALIEALTHKGSDVRRSSALKLGEFREQAKDAIPALQKAEETTVTPGSAKLPASPCRASIRNDFPTSPRSDFPARPRDGRGELLENADSTAVGSCAAGLPREALASIRAGRDLAHIGSAYGEPIAASRRRSQAA